MHFYTSAMIPTIWNQALLKLTVLPAVSELRWPCFPAVPVRDVM